MVRDLRIAELGQCVAQRVLRRVLDPVLLPARIELIDNLLIAPIELLEVQVKTVVAQVGDQIAGHATKDVATVAAELEEGAAEIENNSVDGHTGNYK